MIVKTGFGKVGFHCTKNIYSRKGKLNGKKIHARKLALKTFMRMPKKN